jgi:hypothetical protein
MVFTDSARIPYKWPLIRALKKQVLHGSHTDFARIFTDDWGKIGGQCGERVLVGSGLIILSEAQLLFVFITEPFIEFPLFIFGIFSIDELS